LQQPAVAAAPALSVQPPPCHLQLGDGLVVHNETYYSHFHGVWVGWLWVRWCVLVPACLVLNMRLAGLWCATSCVFVVGWCTSLLLKVGSCLAAWLTSHVVPCLAAHICVPVCVCAGMVIKHACYAHIWDASHSRLFVCGGPLAFGLQGLYLSVWH
jgi:hypothetical protein